MNAFSQLNLQIPDIWEVKDVINKVKNVVLNFTEMEAKVHEATNNEAWGASSTLMQEIAQGSYNYQYFNEIMPTLYKRFTEKEARQWRQIYKALVLLEYLIKNGSERVIDDARAHISMIKIMRNFHYIDDKGKDQGINIRNRAKEIIELLNDTEKIRQERKKARQNRNKYQGVGSETLGGGMGMGGGSRYAGFGSDGISSGSLGFSSITGISSSGSRNLYQDDEEQRNNRYESSKYDDFDDEQPSRSSSHSSPAPSKRQEAKPATAAKKATDLFDFGDDSGSTSKANDDDWGDFTSGPSSSNNANKTSGATANIFDDFDDFQSAPAPAPAPIASATTTTKPVVNSSNDLFDLLGSESFSAAPAPQAAAPAFPVQSSPLSPATAGSSQPSSAAGSVATETAKVSNASLPGGIWSQASGFVSLDTLGKSSTPVKPTVGPSMNAMKHNSVNAGWSNWASNNATAGNGTNNNNNTKKQPSPFDDLLS